MDRSWTVQATQVKDGPLTPFGPVSQGTGRQLKIASTFERRVSSSDSELSAILTCSYIKGRVSLNSICIETRKSNGLGARDLNGLGLPSMIHEASKQAIDDYSFWASEFSRASQEAPKSNEQLARIAQIYWFEHATHGNPRQSIMSYLGIARSTCNLLLRKVEKLYPLPREN